MAPKKQKSISRGSTQMSMSEKSSRFLFKVAKTTKGSSLFPTLFITLLLYCFVLLIARHLGQCSSQSLGVFFFFWLVYHVTPQMLKMTTLKMKFSGAFLDNDFI